MNPKLLKLIAKYSGSSECPSPKRHRVVKQSKARVSAPTIRSEAIANPELAPKVHIFPIDLNVLNEAIEMVLHGIGRDVTRHSLNLVFIEHGNRQLQTTTTDGSSLSHVELDHPLSSPRLPSFVIPSQYLEQLAGMKGIGKVQIPEVNKYGRIDHFTISSNSRSLSIDLNPSATFPPWRHVSPQREDLPASFTISANLLVGEIRKIPKSPDLTTIVAFAFTDKTVSIGPAAKDNNGNNIPDPKPLVTLPYTGILTFQRQFETYRLFSGYDKKLLLRSLKSMGNNKVTFRFEDDISPVRIELASDPEQRFDVIMPIRLHM